MGADDGKKRKLYSKSGDDGSTLLPGRSVAKSDPTIAALGALDEVNAALGLCASAAATSASPDLGRMVSQVQEQLLAAGAMLATGNNPPGAELDGKTVSALESWIDRIWDELEPLEHLIVPRGCELACRLHMARTICRRAERQLVAAHQTGQAVPKVLLAYLNRLGDLLFAMARQANRDAGCGDETWRG